MNAMQTPEVFERYKMVANLIGMPDYSNQLIHYTSLDTLEKMLSSNELWFGRTSDMNDTSECDHFLEAVIENSMQLLGSHRTSAIEQRLRFFQNSIRNHTYISSWCEYFEAEPNGKLSMWRGYGDNGGGVGIVIDSSNLQPSKLTMNKIGFFVYTAKMKYVPKAKAVDLANDYIRRLSALPDPELNLSSLSQYIILILAQAPTVKHDGFKEEEELRFIHMPQMLELTQNSSPYGRIENIMTSTGQRSFYAFPLINYPDFDFDLRKETLIKKIVIGPRPDQKQRAQAVRDILKRHGLAHIAVELCAIPYR